MSPRRSPSARPVTAKDLARLDALEALRALVAPGDTVFCIQRHVSRSGMMRHISFKVAPKVAGKPSANTDGGLADITHYVAAILDLRRADGWSYNAVKVSGCGMDMGFATVYALSHALYPEGFGDVGVSGWGAMSAYHMARASDFVGKRPATPEEARQWINEGARFSARNGDASGWETDGGYALLHRWM